MIVSLIQRSQHDHVYVCFGATDRRRREFASLGIELIELGSENIDEAIAFMRENVDIVHAANSGGPEPGVHIGIESGKPTVETCQSPSRPQGLHHNPVTVVAVSAGINVWWAPEKADRVIYSCAEPIMPTNRREAKGVFDLDPEKPVIGRLGRLEGLKRPHDFVRAVRDISRERPDTQFLLVGDGSDGEGIRHMAASMLENDGIDIRMPGMLHGTQKDLAYSAMDVFLYPTTQEGFGIVFPEAMSVGLPIVTYSDPVNIDVVMEAGVFVVDNEFVNVAHPFRGLARVTIDLLENEREYKRIAEAGQALYDRRYRPEIMAAQYDALYEELAL